MTTQKNNSIMFIPPPTGGINARDPWWNMDGKYCISQINIKPDYNYSSVRAGFQNIANTNPAIGAIPYILKFPLRQSNGTDTYLLICSGGQVYEQDSAGTLTARGTFSPNANCCQFRDKLFVAGGGIAPYDFVPGAFTATAWTINGSGGAVLNSLATPWVYRSRLFFTYGTSAYYGIRDGISGALTEFPLLSLITEGSTLAFGGRTQVGGDLQDQDFCVFVTNAGEILVYSGADPAADDWKMYGRFKISPPYHAGSFFYYGSDLHIVTTQGIVAMSDILANKKEGSDYVTISRDIDPELAAMFSASQSAGYLDIGRAAISPRENLLYLSAFDLTAKYNSSAGHRIFYVMNLSTKAWGVFIPPNLTTGYIFSNPVSDGRQVRFLTGSNTIYTFLSNQSTYDVELGVNSKITWSIQTAYLSDKKLFNKKFNKIRPIIGGSATSSLWSSSDFDPTLIFHGLTSETGYFIKKFRDINQYGAFISVKLQSFLDDASTQKGAFYGAMLSYESGSDIP